MPPESPAAVQPWGCSGEFMGHFRFRAVQTLAFLLKSSRKDPVSATCITGGCFYGVEPGGCTEMQQMPSHSGGETWPRCPRVKGAGRFCALNHHPGAAWLHTGTGSVLPTVVPLNPKTWESSHIPTQQSSAQWQWSELQLHLVSSCHTMRSSHATQIGQKKLKVPFKTWCLLD